MDKVYEYIGTRIYLLPLGIWESTDPGDRVCRRMKMKGQTAGKAHSKESHQPGGWVCGSQLSRGENKARQRLGRTRSRVSNLVEDGKKSSSSS